MSISVAPVTFEHHRPAFGIAETRPRISYRFEGTAVDWEQSQVDIEITHDGTPKVYNVKTSESVLISWPGTELKSKDTATVRARAHGLEGQPSSDWSQPSTVETGLLTTDDWQGAFPIAADRATETNATKRPVHFRKDFSVNTTIAKARLYITALGLYVAEINGKRVGDHVLAPGWQSYSYRHVYDTYDVTDLLQQGDNTIGATIGEGWYAGRIGFNTQIPRNLWGDTLGLLCLLSVTENSGKETTVKSDLSWSASTGPIVSSEIYDGEVYNSAAELKGWSTPKFDDSGWSAVKQLPMPAGSLVPSDGAPIKRVEQVTPVSILKSKSGKTVIDFGQNLVGWLKVTVSGPSGTNITFHHAEVMNDGEIDTVPLRSAKQRDTLILSGNATQTWEPSFTYHGFRYVQVDGWPSATPLDGTSVVAQVVHSDMERTGYFESSHALLNRFHENVIWSLRGNFLGVPTDCPQRDERLGWTGDAHAFMPTANYLYDASGFWRGWLKDAWSEQKRGDYMVPPNFADKQMLEEQYDAAQAWIDTGIPRNDVGLWDRSTFQFADWLDPKAPAEDAGAATTDKHLVSDAYLIEMTRLLSNLSKVLGKDDIATQYASQREDLIKEFHKAWTEPYPVIANVTQTALALGIAFDIWTPNTAARKVAAETLREVIKNNTYLVGTGFAGTQQLGNALTSINATADFYKMLQQTQVPSWLYAVTMNGTTTWERWDSMLPDGSINTGTMTSFNHYSFGSVADWIHKKIGGIAPGSPGWKTVVVAPEPGGDITSASAHVLSPYGAVNSSWRVEADGFHLTVTVPPNSKAEVVLPGSGESATMGSGTKTFFVEAYTIPE
ncbi:uncharacterized protein CC84DRAFT_1134936 [Paraphaeosphaeria sporulosa]|uniref:alpha-L-rhamnosidase n=1 Tax=Paraphaeosphaeria sporulosa TaxID=1460663 RepID=A0A177CZM5_9PLEO|nr:uncharacterized protein CC84DRAFT_1134936 [Paraphaeosphaeria sporulosa]OAG12352.1 hypothetical protein CC84DRAFT_1134936 [Paraphaeosphaeria sporulosa]